MNLLLPVFAVMTAVAVVALLWPLFRQRRTPERASFELGVYRDQLAEIERDRERGLIAPAEAKAARLEIERRILRAAAAGGAPQGQNQDGGGRRAYVLGAALLVPVLSLGLYAALGAPELPDQPLAVRQDRVPQGPQGPDIAEMVARLQARLAEAPDDLEGWLMLGRSRAALGENQAAIAAYRQAQALSPDEPNLLAGLGESLVAAAGGVVTPEAKGLFARLLERDPGDPRAGFYLGWADAQAGDHHAALERWRKLLAAAPVDAPWRPQVVEAVRNAAQELDLDPDAVLAQIPAPPPSTPAAPQPSDEDVAEAAAMPPEERQAMIASMVERLQARMEADGSDVEGWLRLAQARLVLGELDRARATFEQALKLHPQDPGLLKGYAGTLLGPVRPETGLPEIDARAADLYRRAADLRPADPEPWWYLGIRALQEGRKDEARASWQKVLRELDPSHPEYAAIKDRLDRLGG